MHKTAGSHRVRSGNIPLFRSVRKLNPVVYARDADVESFQAKVLIETLEHTCNKLIYDPKRECAYRISFDAEDDDGIVFLQLLMIACVGIGLCFLAQRK